jgi:replicative DNA helicase
MAGKVALPSNIEAERSVLGAMLMDDNAVAVALSSLTENTFSDVDPRNKLVFQAIKELGDRHLPVDPTTVTDELINTKTIDDAGGADYLLELVESSISPDNIDHYIKIVKDQAVLRNFLLTMDGIKKDYAEGSATDIGEFIASSSQKLESIASERSVGEFKSAEVLAEIISRQIDLESNNTNRRLTGVDTGYRRLNNFTHGWQKDDLIVVAARPSVGKTAFALNLAYNGTIYQGKTVAFFSAEMSSAQLMKRLTASVALVNSEDIQTGSLTPKDRVKVATALGQIGKTKLYFDDTPNPKLGDLLAKARKLKAAQPDLSLIVIDYLGLIEMEERPESRVQEVSQVTRSLKELARSLHVPVIILAQLNRDVDQTDSKVPMLSNLRESGSIEQDADLVLLMYRNDYYNSLNQNVKPKGIVNNEYSKHLQDQVTAQNQVAGADKTGNISVVQILVAKNRNGKTGEVTLLFSKNYSKFDNPSPEMESQQARLMGQPVPTDDE